MVRGDFHEIDASRNRLMHKAFIYLGQIFFQITRQLLTKADDEPASQQSSVLTNIRPNTGGDDLLKLFLALYKTAPNFLIVPRKFYTLISVYIKIYKSKKRTISERHKRLEVSEFG